MEKKSHLKKHLKEVHGKTHVHDKNLEKFKQVEEDLAKEVLKVLGRNLWYLTEIIILFSLFSSRVDDDMKSRIAAKLVSLTHDDTIQFGLPTYPDLTPTMELSVLVTGKSLKFFNITGTGSEWLNKPVAEWESDGEFVKARNFVLCPPHQDQDRQ